MRATVVQVFLGVLIATNASAQERPTTVTGEGTVGCGEYLEDRRKNNKAQDYAYATWLRGFISGFNFATRGKQITGVSAPATLLAYMDKYCRDDPLGTVAGGAFNLAREMADK
jgi:hypothetical protein